jgi:DNA-binding transcriptional regulator LsrR (DeoR family)
MLKDAKNVYWRENVQFIEENVTSEEKMQVLARIGRKDLARRLSEVSQRHTGRRGPVLRIFSGDEGGDDKENSIRFAQQAAPYVKGLIERAHTCGVTWGGMLGNLVAALRAMAMPPPWTSHSLEFVPLSGEPLGDEPTAFSSSSLSHELGKLAIGERYDARYLGMVPAFLPAWVEKSDIQAIRKLIALVRSYVEIFGPLSESGGPPPLAARLEMILTSVGPADNPFGFIRGRLLETGKVTTEELKDLIVGDIGGVCIKRPGLSPEQISRLESVTSRWTGLQLEHLKACAIRAAQEDSLSGKPGVVVISRGAKRAAFVYETIKLGLVSQLLIDQNLAQELETISARDPS